LQQIERVDVLLLLAVDVRFQNLAQFAGLLDEFVDLVLKAGFFAFHTFSNSSLRTIANLSATGQLPKRSAARMIDRGLSSKRYAKSELGYLRRILPGETLVANMLIQI